MFQSARGKMPAIDYVSIVASLYQDKRAILFGTGASAIAAGVSAWSAQSPLLLAHALLFVLTTFLRYREAVIFNALNIRADDADLAETWERRSLFMGGFAAFNYGAWCFSSLVFVDQPYAELASIAVSIAALVGIVGRNFGLDRLIVLQSLFVGVPLCAGLVIAGDIYHMFLASLFAPMLVSFRAVAKDVRRVLLNAVHDRVEVSKLVNELDTTLETISHGICMIDADLRISVTNPQFLEMVFGLDESDIIGEKFSDLVRFAEQSGTLSRLTAERLMTAIAMGENAKLVLQLAEKAQCEVSLSVQSGQIALVVEDISERIEAENRIRFMARYDGLTGLPNRAYFTEQVSERLEKRAKRELDDSENPMLRQSMLMVMDVDDFKHINDSLGHLVGDSLLQQVADRIQLNLDSACFVGRFGGDEFTIFVEDGMDEDKAKQTAERLHDVVSKPFIIGNEVMLVRFSMGYVLCSQCSGDLESMFKRADLALYAAKGRGKGQYCAFHEDMDFEYNHRQILKKAFKSALANEELYLAFQPIVDAKTGAVRGCEALARWHHPEHGNIPPSVFIPIAEEIGAITELGAWVLRQATSECVKWPDNMFVSVNISARDFQAGQVEAMVEQALDVSGLVHNRLEIEVTESVLIEERERASQTLRALADQGIGIALDDFGTGYSSLAYVHDMPFSKIKIDRAFTADVTHDEKALKLMRSIARMSKELDMSVTVEGVETQDQLDVIIDLGLVDTIQGFLFGTPVPQSEIGELIARFRSSRQRKQDRNSLVHADVHEGKIVARVGRHNS